MKSEASWMMSLIEHSRIMEHPNVIYFFWDATQSRLIDEDGFVVENPYMVLPPWLYQLFLLKQEYIYAELSPMLAVELFWPEED